MAAIIEVRIPKYPECWETCGSCGAGDVTIDDICVLPGDTVARDDTILVLETAKVALDIPAPADGRVLELFVGPGDKVEEGQLIMTLEPL
jgi:pyruvate/2-oxoglutarate dehydrogenase complex dihydrolipoamide acyltransferase (E2) component